jgi:Zn-dependent protease with chaperone function
MVPKVALMGLKASDFRHRLDLEATQVLSRIPGLDWVVRSLVGSMAEQALYLDNISTSLLIGPQQLPHLHGLLLEACQILDIEPPQLYLRQNPTPNAYTFAMRGKRPFVVLHSSLLELLTPSETQAVIAHELGHLKCDHGVYLTLANVLVLAASQLPPLGQLIAPSLQQQLLTWVRCAELTCDRAALLVSQEPRIVQSVLMKLAGGSPQWTDQLNVEAFVAQARSYDLEQDDFSRVWKTFQTNQLTHPLPVLRARELDRWANAPAYQQLLKSFKTSKCPHSALSTHGGN